MLIPTQLIYVPVLPLSNKTALLTGCFVTDMPGILQSVFHPLALLSTQVYLPLLAHLLSLEPRTLQVNLPCFTSVIAIYSHVDNRLIPFYLEVVFGKNNWNPVVQLLRHHPQHAHFIHSIH